MGMDRNFSNDALAISFIWFILLGPLIGGIAFAVKEITVSSSSDLFIIMLYVPIFSYMVGIFPAVVCGLLWYFFSTITYTVSPSLINKKSTFHMLSTILSGAFGYVSVPIADSFSPTPAGEISLTVSPLVGLFCGFMATKSLLKST